MTVAIAIGLVIAQSVIANIIRMFGFAPEIFSPKVRIKQGDINYTYDVSTHSGILTVKNLPTVYAVSVQDTKSMLPVVGAGHIVLMTKDFKIEDLTKGDNIHYMKPGHSNLHSIAGKFKDKEGIFYICKGVNCFFPDPFPIRPEDIVSLMRGILC